MKKAIVVLAIVALFTPPIAADVIPSRRGSDAKKNQQKVATELTKRGVDATTAQAQVLEMSSNDLAYFAADGRRVQNAAGLLLEEWILGGVMAAAVAGAALFIYGQSNDDD